MILLLLTGGSLFAGLVLAVPLPWQRYSLPLLPLVSLLAGVGFDWVFGMFVRSAQSLRRPLRSEAK